MRWTENPENEVQLLECPQLCIAESKIKNQECPHAGELKMKGCEEIGEKPGVYAYTICYKEGGRLACTLGI